MAHLTCSLDTGIGMTPDELRKNLGTIAKSGTSEFLSTAETSKPDGNLIGRSFFLGGERKAEARSSN